jgi:hypothetical protein
MFKNQLTRHAVDIVNTLSISGWALPRFFQHRKTTLQFYLDDTLAGETVAKLFRQDLLDHGLHKDGCCGFEFSFERPIDTSTFNFLHIYCGGRKPLSSIAAQSIPQVFPDTLPKIFFMHIPKTAGTSFNTFVQQRYPQNSTAIHVQATAEEKYDTLFTTKLYLAGHLRLAEIIKRVNLDDYDLFTLLRQPYKHLHSHLNWVRGVGANTKIGFYENHPECIKTLGTRLHNVKDSIPDILSTFVAELDGFEIDFFDNCQTRYFLDYRPDRVSEADLHNAIDNFKYFKRIGVTEKYDQFVQEFCNLYGLSDIKQEQPLNKSKHTRLYESGSSEMMELLSPLVKYDLLLYEAAVNSLASA